MEPMMSTTRTGQPGFSRAAVAYVTLVLGLGAGLLCLEWVGSGPVFQHLPAGSLLFWLALTLVSELFWLETPAGGGMISMSLTVNMASLFVLPAPLVLSVGWISVVLSDLLIHRRGLLKAFFNGAQTAVALSASLLVLRLAIGNAPPYEGSVFTRFPQAAAAAPLAFFLVNTILVSGVISLCQRRAFLRVWRENYLFGYQVLASGIQFLLGVGLVLSTQALGYLSGLFYVLFFFFVRDSYHRFLREWRESGRSQTRTRSAA
jgi:hypothetical protein